MAATHERSTTSADALLLRMLRRERARLSNRHGAGWLEQVEAKYHKPKPGLATSGPPPVPNTFVD